MFYTSKLSWILRVQYQRSATRIYYQIVIKHCHLVPPAIKSTKHAFTIFYSTFFRLYDYSKPPALDVKHLEKLDPACIMFAKCSYWTLKLISIMIFYVLI